MMLINILQSLVTKLRHHWLNTLGLICLSGAIIALLYLRPTVLINHHDYLFTIIYTLAGSALIWLTILAWPRRRDALKKYLALLDKRFQGAYKFLKTTPLKHPRYTHLVQLPTVLIIGLSNSGKSQLLYNAPLKYLLRRKKPLTIKICDWWVSKDTCFIDMPGRHFDNQPETLAKENIIWQKVLKLLKKNIQGHLKNILLTINQHELLTSDYSVLLLRLRQLNQQFPQATTTLILTQCDLINGFKEFFADLGIDELEQPWGIPLPASCDQAEFIANFDALLKRLNQQVLFKLQHERNPHKRHRIKDFPLQLENIKLQIVNFLNQYQAQISLPPITALFMVSSNIADSAVINSHSDLLPAIANSQQKPQNYFIKYVLSNYLIHCNDVIIKKNIIPTKNLVFASLATLIASYGAYLLWQDYAITENHYRILNKNINQYAQKKSSAFDLKQTLHFLDQLAMGNKPSNAEFIKFNYYEKMYEKNQSLLYVQAVQELLLKNLQKQFSDYLNLSINKNPYKYYTALKAYLMLSLPSSHYSDSFISSAYFIAINSNYDDKLHKKLLQHLKAAPNIALQENFDKLVVENAREYLLSLNALERASVILQNMQDNSSLEKFSLDNLFLDQASKHEYNFIIPRAYTAYNYPKIMAREIALATNAAIYGNWVLGKINNPTIKPTEILDLTHNLQSMYVHQYSQYWQSLLAKLTIKTARNLEQLNTNMRTFIEERSAFFNALALFKQQAGAANVTINDENFTALQKLVNDNHADNQLTTIINGIKNALVFLQPAVSGGPQVAYKLLKQRLEKQPDPILQLRIIASQTPQPVQAWLLGFAKQANELLTNEAGRFLNLSWQRDVFQTYESAIANHYPFTKQVEAEVSHSTFINFFAPNGKLENYVKDMLGPLLVTEGEKWHWATIDNQALPFDNTIPEQLQYGHLISNNLAHSTTLDFQLVPYQLDTSFKQLRLQINHNPPQLLTKTFANLAWQWPENATNLAIDINLIDKSAINFSSQGYWSWMKLLQKYYDPNNTKQLIADFSDKNHYFLKYGITLNGQPAPSWLLHLDAFKLASQIFNKS